MRYTCILLFMFSNLFSSELMPSEFWNSYENEEKIAFINGAYGAFSKLKSHHKSEVKKQYIYNDNWIEPYYIERYYDIVDEYLSKDVGYNLKIIAMHMDAFYTNYDNLKIPVFDALRIVSLIQDGEKRRANSLLLRFQKRYNN